MEIDEEAPMSARRCRRTAAPSATDSPSSSESDDESPTRRRSSPISLRATVRRLLVFGLGSSAYERAILFQAATLCDLNPEDAGYVRELLDIPTLEDPPPDIAGALASNSVTSNTG
jgi:hypothetical protein